MEEIFNHILQMLKGKIMKKNFAIAGAFLAAMLLVTSVNNAEEEKKEAEIKCPIAGKVISKKVSAMYKGAKVYVCCGKCKKAIEADPSKHLTKINHQLVQTKQAKNVKCPIAGKKLNPKTKIELAGTTVAFCCDGCKSKVEGEADLDKKIELVFNEKAFKKGFKITKVDKKD